MLRDRHVYGMLRDRHVYGIAHPQWQKRLLSEEGLCYDKAIKLLLSMESADKEVKGLGSQTAKQPQPVNYVAGQRTDHFRSPLSDSTAGKASCYQCSKGNHKPSGKTTLATKDDI